MKHSSYVFGISMALIAIVALRIPAALAATFPITGADMYIKSIESKKVTYTSTDKNGFFSVSGMIDGSYNVFVDSQNVVPVLFKSKNGIISGRVVILTDGTTTTDQAPAKAAKKAPNKPTVIKKTKPFIAPLLNQNE